MKLASGSTLFSTLIENTLLSAGMIQINRTGVKYINIQCDKAKR